MSQEVVFCIRDEEAGHATKSSSVKDVTKIDNGKYPGRGTAEDPYVVDWDLGDPENPFNWPSLRKWIITLQVSVYDWCPMIRCPMIKRPTNNFIYQHSWP